MKSMALLKNRIMDYDWGSDTFIRELTGNPDSKGVQAEMWMGSHSRGPSMALCDNVSVPLNELIEKDPPTILGPKVAEKFDNKLPFLFKVLSAARPLSIQAHPDKEQAEEGFRRENTMNIPIDSPLRNYRDSNHKPELICALEPMWIMKGFRSVSCILELAEVLGSVDEELGINILRKESNAEGLKNFFVRLMSMEQDRREVLIRRILESIEIINNDNPAFEWIKRLHHDYSSDPGVLSPLFLNVVKIQPGEAIYIGARELHAYLMGSGLEIMANSDNVLRGGATRKHMDLYELINILSFETGTTKKILPSRLSIFESVYRSPAQEFMLSVIDLPDEKSVYHGRTLNSAEIIINLKGCGEVTDRANNMISLKRGASLFIPASAEEYHIRGEALVYRASIPSVC